MEEDLYSGYDDDHNPLADSSTGSFRTSPAPGMGTRLGTAQRMGTAAPAGIRMGTAMGRAPAGMGLGTAARMGTGAAEDGARPMTAVKGAGYVSSRAGSASRTPGGSTPLARPKGPSPAELCRKMEAEVHDLIEAAAELVRDGNASEGVETARRARQKEEALQAELEKHDLRDNINMDLHFAADMCLAHCAHCAGMEQEALSIYKALLQNPEFPLAGRLRINIGNVYFKQRKFVEAIKNYRMALDQIPAAAQGQAGFDVLRGKVLRNIGVAFLQQGMYQDAGDNFEAAHKVQPDHVSAFNRLVCTFMIASSVEQAHALKSAFLELLRVPGLSDKRDDAADVLGDDSAQAHEQKRSAQAAAYVVMGARLVASRISPGDADAGFQWCAEQVAKAGAAHVSAEVLMAKATHFMANGDTVRAIDVLKDFERHDGSTRAKAATNLSFLYLLEGKTAEAEKYAALAKQTDEYNVRALVNKGNCEFLGGDVEAASASYGAALRNEPDCVEAIYNVGLALKAQKKYGAALEQFLTINGIIADQVEVLYQIGDIYYLKAMDALQSADAAARDAARKDCKHAIKMLNRVYNFVGGEPGILARLGALYFELGQEDEALKSYLESYAEYPLDMDVLSWLGAHFVRVEQYEAAVHYFATAAKMQPSEPKWLLMVASCYRRTQKFETAVGVYEQVHQKFPDNAEALKFLVHLTAELQDAAKHDEYQLRLTKLERFAAMQDALPTAAAKEPADSTARMLQDSYAKQDGSILAYREGRGDGAGLGGGDLLPEQGDGTARGVGGAQPGGKDDWEQEELGVDLLPGLD